MRNGFSMRSVGKQTNGDEYENNDARRGEKKSKWSDKERKA